MLALTLSSDLMRVGHELAFMIRTFGLSSSQTEGMRSIHSSVAELADQARVLEQALLHSPPLEGEFAGIDAHVVTTHPLALRGPT